MPKEQYVIEIDAPAEKVFAHMDRIENVGWHMSGRGERGEGGIGAMPLMGGRLELQIIDGRRGAGATYRWSGKVMGMEIDISETVSRWVENREKVWHTIGRPRMIVMSGYVMRLFVSPIGGGRTKVLFEIEYTLPSTPWGRVAGWLLAPRYARWCLRRACEDAKAALEKGKKSDSNTA